MPISKIHSQIGWKLEDGKSTALWYTGPQMPQNVVMNISDIGEVNPEAEAELHHDESDYDSDDDYITDKE